MNVLTPNRILQKGDEYRDNGTWKPVPDLDFGLQVMFTDYAEVRRPSEKPFPVPASNTVEHDVPLTRPSNDSHPLPTHANAETSEGAKRENRTKLAAGKPISKPISLTETVQNRTRTPEAEKEKPPVPTPSGAGETLVITGDHREPHAASYLPTVVSTKAHANPAQEITSRNLAKVTALRGTPETDNESRTEQAKPPVSPTPLTGDVDPATGSAPTRAPTHIKIKYKGITHDHPDRPVWTGRNGTFTGYGLEAMTVTNNIMLSPIGKRGVGNCAIQFPKAIIPELLDFLKKQL